MDNPRHEYVQCPEHMQTLGLQAKEASAPHGRCGCRHQEHRHCSALARGLRARRRCWRAGNNARIWRAPSAVRPVGADGGSPQAHAKGHRDRWPWAASSSPPCPTSIGEIIGMKQQPSGIRVGQMRVPLGVFGMIYESRPNVTIEAASAGDQERQRLHPARRLRGDRVQPGAGAAGAAALAESRPAGRSGAAGADHRPRGRRAS